MKRLSICLLCLGILSGLFCAAVFATTSHPEVMNTGEYQYVLLTDGTAEIQAYTGEETELIIPSNLNGVKVTAIGSNAFVSSKNLKSVIIPDGVTIIGNSAFSSCYNLSSVIIPNTVISIEESAFSSCGRLKSVTIPDSVSFIGKKAFLACNGLKEITISKGITSILDETFSYCMAMMKFVK